MKKVLSIVIALMFLINTTLAYTVKITVKGVDLVVTGEVGNTIEIEKKIPEIVGWEIKSGNIEIINNTFIMPEGNVEIEAIIEEEPEKYMLTVETPTVTRTEEKQEGQSVTVAMELEMPYRFINWTATGIELTSEEKVSPSITFTMPSNAVTLKANYAYGNEDISGANEPKLDVAGLLTPVNWNGVEWVETDKANWVYNYNSVAENVSNGTVEGTGDGAWANAKTADGSMWVWIPRYTYKIESGYHETVKSWNSDLVDGTEETLGKIAIKFSSETIDDTNDSYISHPAFTLETDELTGIWVAKYEMSMEKDGVNVNTTSKEIGNVLLNEEIKCVSKPDLYSWRYISVAKAFENGYNYNRGLDSHMIKNVEWGAVTYLTSALGRTPYINNNSDFKTGYSGVTQNYNGSNGETAMWNSVNGVKASTTHNVFGIYDMSGGNWERVSAYFDQGINTYLSNDTQNDYLGSLYFAVNGGGKGKYVDVYQNSYGETFGDATYEIAGEMGQPYTNAWNQNWSSGPWYDTPGIGRGGYYNESTTAGIYYFASTDSYGNEADGFRVVLSLK